MVKRCRDQRRRRVVLGEVSGLGETGDSADPNDDSQSPVERSREYSTSAQRRHHWKTSDLFPKRFWSCTLVVLGLVAVIGLLNGLDWVTRLDSALLDASARAALQMGQPGSLSAWFSSFLFVLSGLASLQIYALRRHRCDDYGGAYRIWLWMAALFLLGSINCVVDLEWLANVLIRGGTQIGVVAAAQLVIGAKILLLTSLVVRGAYELRASRGALFCVLCVWAAYGGAWVLQLPSVHSQMVDDARLYRGNFSLVASATLLLTLVIYFRFVFLRAHGLVRPATARSAGADKPVRRKKTKTVAEGGKRKTQPATNAPVASESRKKGRKSTKPVDVEHAQEESSDSEAATRTSPLGARLKLRSAKPSKPAGKATGKGTGKRGSLSADKVATQPSETSAGSCDPELDNEILQLSRKPNLSKSERRRLRKLEKRQRRAA